MFETLAWIAVGATLIPAHRAARQQAGTFAALVTVEAIAVALALLATFHAPTWLTIAQEDGPVEWATFVAFVMAAAWFVLVVRKRGTGWLFTIACLLLAAFCLVVAGEEISWGQRLFGFKPPDVFLERNFQQELNLHNVLMDERGLGFQLESKHLVMAIALGFGVVWPWIVQRERFASLAPLAPPFSLAPIFVGIVAVQLSYAIELTGEGAELVTGLGFFAAALVASATPARRTIMWLAGSLVFGWVLSFAIARVLFASDEEGTRLATAEIAQLEAEVRAGMTPKLSRKTIHKRVFTAVRDGYLRLDRPRTDRHGYYLDPWNNPYWIHYDRKTKRGAIYSFGPNRRRDVAVRDPSSDAGDDVLLRFAFPARTAADD